MTSYPRMYKIFHHLFSLHYFVSFMKEKPPINFYSVFDHFSQTYEVKKFCIIKLYLNVSDVIHTNRHTKYANCGLHVNF